MTSTLGRVPAISQEMRSVLPGPSAEQAARSATVACAHGRCANA